MTKIPAKKELRLNVKPTKVIQTDYYLNKHGTKASRSRAKQQLKNNKGEEDHGKSTQRT